MSDPLSVRLEGEVVWFFPGTIEELVNDVQRGAFPGGPEQEAGALREVPGVTAIDPLLEVNDTVGGVTASLWVGEQEITWSPVASESIPLSQPIDPPEDSYLARATKRRQQQARLEDWLAALGSSVVVHRGGTSSRALKVVRLDDEAPLGPARELLASELCDHLHELGVPEVLIDEALSRPRPSLKNLFIGGPLTPRRCQAVDDTAPNLVFLRATVVQAWPKVAAIDAQEVPEGPVPTWVTNLSLPLEAWLTATLEGVSSTPLRSPWGDAMTALEGQAPRYLNLAGCTLPASWARDVALLDLSRLEGANLEEVSAPLAAIQRFLDEHPGVAIRRGSATLLAPLDEDLYGHPDHLLDALQHTTRDQRSAVLWAILRAWLKTLAALATHAEQLEAAAALRKAGRTVSLPEAIDAMNASWPAPMEGLIEANIAWLQRAKHLAGSAEESDYVEIAALGLRVAGMSGCVKAWRGDGLDAPILDDALLKRWCRKATKQT